MKKIKEEILNKSIVYTIFVCFCMLSYFFEKGDKYRFLLHAYWDDISQNLTHLKIVDAEAQHQTITGIHS
jgi:hypothetical protein